MKLSLWIPQFFIFILHKWIIKYSDLSAIWKELQGVNFMILWCCCCRRKKVHCHSVSAQTEGLQCKKNSSSGRFFTCQKNAGGMDGIRMRTKLHLQSKQNQLQAFMSSDYLHKIWTEIFKIASQFCILGLCPTRINNLRVYFPL